MLEARSISRHYGDFKAVDAVSFTANYGEIVGLLGHNGAGKTTIMKMLSGFLEPDEGDILFEEQSVIANPLPLQNQLGYLPENLPVYPELSVASYLDYASELKGLKGKDKRSEIRRVVEATELGEKMLAPIATLSRGLKQRVGVAQAILGRPTLLIMDEPTNGLDPTQTEAMRSLIRSLSESATIILSTHIMQEVEAVCDRALILRNGQLAVDSALTELKNENRIRLISTVDKHAIESALKSIPEIGTVQSAVASDGKQWIISLNEGSDLHGVISKCAEQLVSKQIPILGIQPDTQDLQSLFLDVNNSSTAAQAQEVAHVA